MYMLLLDYGYPVVVAAPRVATSVRSRRRRFRDETPGYAAVSFNERIPMFEYYDAFDNEFLGQI